MNINLVVGTESDPEQTFYVDIIRQGESIPEVGDRIGLHAKSGVEKAEFEVVGRHLYYKEDTSYGMSRYKLSSVTLVIKEF